VIGGIGWSGREREEPIKELEVVREGASSKDEKSFVVHIQAAHTIYTEQKPKGTGRYTRDSEGEV
jgi:hypothetical protein